MISINYYWLIAIIWASFCISDFETATATVSVSAVDTDNPTLTVIYNGKSRRLELATDVSIEIDGRKSDYRLLMPGDIAEVKYDTEKSLVTKVIVKRTPLIPAEPLLEGWDEIDQRLVFLMVRLANVEGSLEAVENVLDGKNAQVNSKLRNARRADRENEELDRKGGGPLKWSVFYGMTAEKFFYHPTDRNTKYHTETVLGQQGSQADNKVGGGVPSSQGLPVHQRPPQFDYIYRANENARDRAEAEASSLKNKLDQLAVRRRNLEIEQAGLWVEIAFRAISHYDLDKKPAYRFDPLMLASDTDFRRRMDTIRVTSSFMGLVLSIIAEADKDQAGTFTRIKPAVAKARREMNDTLLRLAIDSSDKRSSVGRFVSLAKRIDDIAANLTDSYVVSMEGDSAKDSDRKETFRAQLQLSLINYAQIVLALDEMSSEMVYEYGYKPDVNKRIEYVTLSNIDPVTQPSSLAQIDVLADQPILSMQKSKKEPKQKVKRLVEIRIYRNGEWVRHPVSYKGGQMLIRRLNGTEAPLAKDGVKYSFVMANGGTAWFDESKLVNDANEIIFFHYE